MPIKQDPVDPPVKIRAKTVTEASKEPEEQRVLVVSEIIKEQKAPEITEEPEPKVKYIEVRNKNITEVSPVNKPVPLIEKEKETSVIVPKHSVETPIVEIKDDIVECVFEETVADEYSFQGPSLETESLWSDIQEINESVEPKEQISEEVVQNDETSPDVRPLYVQSSAFTELVGAAVKPRIETAEIVETLEVFEDFIVNIEALDKELESVEEIHKPIMKIEEITDKIREVSENPTIFEKVEIIEELEKELIIVFIELFKAGGMEYSESQVRYIVDLWVKHDVLKTFEGEKKEYVDKDMRESLRQFMQGISKLKQLIDVLCLKLGRYVLSQGYQPIST